MKQDWAAVAVTIEEHLARVGLDQRGLAKGAGVALSIVGELRHNTVQRAAVTSAASKPSPWHPGSIQGITHRLTRRGLRR
jgi:hypothetical protein